MGLVSKSKSGSKNNKYMNESAKLPKVEQQNFDEMFDTNQGSSLGKKRGSMNSQFVDGEHDNASNGPKNLSHGMGYHQAAQFGHQIADARRGSEGMSQIKLSASIKDGMISKQKSSVSQGLSAAVPQVQRDQDSVYMYESQQNIMIEGQLNENVNKRSEAANRKYRAFIHFLKYQKNHPSEKKNSAQKLDLKIGSTDKKKEISESGVDKTSPQTSMPQKDELSQASDADDDFDDRYIHLIAAHSEINKAWGVIYPDATFKGIWDLFGLLFIIYQAILIPFRLCFDVEATGGILYVEDIMDAAFMVDIIVTFNTGFYKKGYLVMKRKDIIKNYFKTWFWIDLVATFPYSWVLNVNVLTAAQSSSSVSGTHTAYKTPQLLRLLKIIRFLRFLRLLRVLKLKKLLYKFEEIIMSDMLNAILGFFKVITVILFIAHWIACIFYAIGSAELDTEPVCWIVMSNMQDAAIFDKYIISLYWAFTTMTTVGYGDVVPYTMSEKIYAMFSMLIACGVFAYVVGSIETIARRSNTMAAIFKEKILHVNQFLMHKQIPKYLRLKVRRYLEYMFEYKKQYKLSEIEVLNMLNENLKDQVIVHLNGRMLKNTRIFGIFDIRFLSEVTFLLFNETFSMDDHIFEEDENGTKMYFITKGTVVIMQKKSHTYIKELQVDEYFGEISFFSLLNRQATARSRGFTEVLSLSKQSFIKTADLYPDALKTYQDIYLKLTNASDYNSIFVTCYLCGGQGHISINCEVKFHEIEGNLKRQIYKYKQQLIKQQKEQNLNEKTTLKQPEKTKTLKPSDNNDTEEIKTDFSMYSDDEDGDEEEGDESVGSKQDSKGDKTRKPSRDVNTIPRFGGSSPQKIGMTPGGGLRLGINVGAKTIETAEKYIKKDQQLQKNNDTLQVSINKSPQTDEESKQKGFQEEVSKMRQNFQSKAEVEIIRDNKKINIQENDSETPNKKTVKKESSKMVMKGMDFYNKQEVQQDLSYINKEKSQQQQSKASGTQVKQIQSTHKMLRKLESSTMLAGGQNNGNSSPLITNNKQGAVSSIAAANNTNIVSPGVKSILKIPQPQKSKELSQFVLQKNSISSDSESASSLDIHYRKQETLSKPQVVLGKQPTGKNQLVEAKTKGSNRQMINKKVSQDLDSLRINQLINLQTDSQKKSLKQHSGVSGNANMTKTQKSKEQKQPPRHEQHIENFIQSISPFKDLLPTEIGGLKKEQAFGFGQELPNERKRRATLKIVDPQLNQIQGKGPVRVNRDEDNKMAKDLSRSGSIKNFDRRSFKRSTTLLANIKEEHKPEEEKVGVVPNDLTFDFLKDLIAEQEREEKRLKNKNE